MANTAQDIVECCICHNNPPQVLLQYFPYSTSVRCFDRFIVLHGRVPVYYLALMLPSSCSLFPSFVVKSGKKVTPKDPGLLHLTKKSVCKNLSPIISWVAKS